MTDLLDQLPDTPATRRRENTRTRLVRASLDVFVSRGIDGATIDDLVTAAGFTRGAFYSSFAKKDEVFYALFETVTDEVIHMVETSVDLALARKRCTGDDDGEDADIMVAAFEAIRPYGRQWSQLYSEALAQAPRSPEARAQLNTQRHRLRDAIARALGQGLIERRSQCPLGVEHLAQLLIAVFVDLMVQENLDDDDITERAGAIILGIMRSFVVPEG